MKDCCLEIWYETNLVIRMITWEDTRREWGGDRYNNDYFPISYTCNKCGKKLFNFRGYMEYLKYLDNKKII